VRDWELIQANPDRYIHYNGDIGQKYKWILENVYHKTIPPATPPTP
jgi:predicted metal-dependent HD superfamily phosphohydrolase